MERGNTKEQILEAALDLFSVQGYEATSIAQIANGAEENVHGFLYYRKR